MSPRKRALFFGLGTVLIWSTVAAAFKVTLAQISPLQLLLCASSTSTLVLGIIILISGQWRSLHMSLKEYALCALLGFLNPFLYYFTLFKAYELLPAQEAQPLNFTWAITLSLLAVPVLGQRLSAKEIIAICISYTGVLVISTQGDIWGLRFTNGTGVLFALASTLIWAVYWLGNTRFTGAPLAGLFLNFLFGLPWIIAAVAFSSQITPFSLFAVMGAAYIGTFEMGISFVLWLTALKNAAQEGGGGTARVASLIFLSPFLSLFFISYFAGEKILLSTFIGLIFISIGNVLMQKKA